MLIGQERAEAILARALRQGRVSHAYLFAGPEAVGKSTAALLFAQAVNCDRPDEFTTEARRHGEELGLWTGSGEAAHAASAPLVPEPPFDSAPTASVSPCLRGEKLSPCGVCQSCRRIAAGTHPDVHVIVPGSKSGQNISVEQIRDVRQDVARRPIMGRRKLYLVPNAEAMNEEAANTLLKTLEEPPEYVTLILMATSPTRVLPTVLSRCQLVPFGLVPADTLRDWVRASGIDADTAAALAFSAAGRPGLAFRWSREPEVLGRRRQALQLLEETTLLRQQARQRAGESLAALRLAERARSLVGPEDSDGEGGRSTGGASTRVSGGREAGAARRGVGSRRRTEEPSPAMPEVRAPEPAIGNESEPGAKAVSKPAYLRLLDLIRGYYRDLLLLAQGAPESLIWNADRLGALHSAVVEYTPGELLSVLAAVDRCQQFLERNVAPQLALEVLFLDLLQPDR